MEKTRLDELLVQEGLAENRHEAVALILAGRVLIDGQKVDKAGTAVDPAAKIRITGPRLPYVSRGGLKLESGLRDFCFSVEGLSCMDLGASTGGFTDCLLKHGARRVHAFDVGRGQLAWQLRGDPRVVLHEGFNVRRLAWEDVGEPVGLITVDLSFISLRKVLPALRQFSPTSVILLVKPQFEAERSEVSPGGIIESPELQREILERIKSFAAAQGFKVLGETPSPILGQKGNREFLLWLMI